MCVGDLKKSPFNEKACDGWMRLNNRAQQGHHRGTSKQGVFNDSRSLPPSPPAVALFFGEISLFSLMPSSNKSDVSVANGKGPSNACLTLPPQFEVISVEILPVPSFSCSGWRQG